MKLKEKLNYNNKYINTNDYKLITTYTALQKLGNTLESGGLDNIGMNPF